MAATPAVITTLKGESGGTAWLAAGETDVTAKPTTQPNIFIGACFPDYRSTEAAQIVAQRSPLVSVISDKREHDKEASGRHIPLDTVDLPFTGRFLTQVVLIGEELDDRRPAHAVLGGEL